MVYRYGKKVWYFDRLFSATAEESDTIVSIGDNPPPSLYYESGGGKKIVNVISAESRKSRKI